MMADLIRPEDESRHQLTLSMRGRNWGGGLVTITPPPLQAFFSFKETTHNIQVAKTGEHPPFDTV